MKSMLDLLKVVDKVEKPVAINEAVSLSINATGDSACDVNDMVSKIFGLSQKPVTPDMMPKADSNMPMVKAIQSVGGYADQAAKAYVDEIGDEDLSGGYTDASTELDHAVADDPGEVDDVTMKTSGGMNRPHKQFKKEFPGDNPIAESLASKIMEEWKQVKETSISKKLAAYAAASGPDSDYEYGDGVHDKADRLRANIVKKHGEKMGHHADAHAHATHYGRKFSPGRDEFDNNYGRTSADQRITKAGKINKQDQKSTASRIKTMRMFRDLDVKLGKRKTKPNLPEGTK
jgi:hypothetical protein